ncbi:hypothetical protein ON010_g14170 [Phytophthora cinnamomi]|nr:hypothetical protein ON010_g14170 [Phytophthora cinnamomi]
MPLRVREPEPVDGEYTVAAARGVAQGRFRHDSRIARVAWVVGLAVVAVEHHRVVDVKLTGTLDTRQLGAPIR